MPADRPPDARPDDLDDLLRGLDERQLEAVTSEASPLAVIAAAGSGKTTVLTRRIAYRVATGSADARHVLALTFTRDAAGELRRRLRALDVGEPVEAGTFHAVCLRLLRDRALAAGAAPPQIAGDRHRLLKEVTTELRLRVDIGGAAADLDWARARLIAPDTYERSLRSAGRRSALPAARFAEFVAAYEQLKRRRGVLDFDDVLDGVVRAAESDPQWAEAIRWRFRHLFVDEAQDLNPLQHRVLECIRAGRTDLCLVGDPRQAIYGWNGADHTLLAEVERSYPGVTVIRLDRNYRSSPQVVRAGAAALGASGQFDGSSSERADTRSVSVEEFADERVEAVAIAQHVRQLLHTRSGRELAVLARTNDQLTVIDRELAALGITSERSGGRSPLDRALRSALQCGTRERLAAWVDTALSPERESDDDTRRVAIEADRFLASGESGTFATWLDARSPFDEQLAEQRSDAVSVLTFHAAKGREWWGVVVAGLEDHLVPHSSATSEAQRAEEARLLYVALTRAEHHLHITHARRRNGRDSSPSRWLTAVRATADADRPAPPPQPRVKVVDPMHEWREWRAAVARVGGMTDRAVCSDEVLRSLCDSPPADRADLARRLGITVTAAERLRPLPVSPSRAPTPGA